MYCFQAYMKECRKVVVVLADGYERMVAMC